MADESAAWTWNDVVARLREAPTGSTLQIAVSAIAEPTSVGLHPMPTGPDARPVFGVVLDDQMGILVEVSGENYEARLCTLPQVAATPVPASALALQQTTTLSPARPAVVALKQTGALPAPSVPVVVDSRTDLVIQRHREPRSLVSIPAQLPGETMLMTTLLGTLIGAAFGGARGGIYGCSRWRRGWAGVDRGEYGGDFPGDRNGRADHVPRSCCRQPRWQRLGADLASRSCTKTSASTTSRRWRSSSSYAATSSS